MKSHEIIPKMEYNRCLVGLCLRVCQSLSIRQLQLIMEMTIHMQKYEFFGDYALCFRNIRELCGAGHWLALYFGRIRSVMLII